VCNHTSLPLYFTFTIDILSLLPRDTSHVRNILFTLPLPFSLSRANHEQFWPLIDNAYSIRRSRDVGFRKHDARPAHVRHDVICRFKRARAAPLASQGKRASSTKRALIGCDVSFTLLAFPTHYEYYTISQSGDLGLITCSQHSHSLDECDANKRNSLLRKLVGAEVAKGYHPATVIRSLTGEGNADARAQLAAAGGAYLTRQDVINAGLMWRLANPNQLWARREDKNDVSLQGIEALETLANLGWLALQISAISLDKTKGRGIVFADSARLQTLATHGHLSLIDSTHKTNQLEWKLFTLIVRDQYASWLPVAHSLLSHEFGELIAKFLLAIKRWCNWPLRYVLSDDSGAEQRAFRLAFPGLVCGVSEPR
jgi:MULE transposase domain